MRRTVFLLIVLVFVTLFIVFFVNQEGAKSSEGIRYTTHIKPIFENRCVECHGADAPEYKEFKKDKKKYKEMKKGPRMDSYPYLIYFIGWPDTGAVMRRLDDGKNTKDGKPGNMYQYMGETEEERQKNLILFKDWIRNWTLKRWKQIDKKELDKIKVKY